MEIRAKLQAAKGAWPVSYTHLDDFEQIPQSVVMQFMKELPDGYRTVFNLYVLEEKGHKETVSYTHLDVYKRQEYGRPFNRYMPTRYLVDLFDEEKDQRYARCV